MLGKIEGKRRRGQQRIRSLDGITDSMHMNLNKLWFVGEGQEILVCCSSRGHKESDTTWQLNSNNKTYGRGVRCGGLGCSLHSM